MYTEWYGILFQVVTVRNCMLEATVTMTTKFAVILFY